MFGAAITLPFHASGANRHCAYNPLRDQGACQIAVGIHRAQRTVSVQSLTHRDRATPSRPDALLSLACQQALVPASRYGWLAASEAPASDGAYRYILINRRSRSVSTGLITSPLALTPQLTA